MSPANITFVTEDDQSSVEGTVSAVQSLVDQGVSAFVGTAISTQLKAAYPIAQESGVVGFSSVSSAAGLSSLGDYIFRAALAADTLVPGGVAASQAALGYQKVAVIYDTIDVYSTSVKEEMVKALEINDVEVLTVETVETEDREFTTQLTSIMEANPDAIFVSALIPEMKPIMAQARTLGIPAAVPFICAELDGPAVAELGDVAEGSISLLSLAQHVGYTGQPSLPRKLSGEIRNRSRTLGSTVVCDSPYSRQCHRKRTIERFRCNSRCPGTDDGFPDDFGEILV